MEKSNQQTPIEIWFFINNDKIDLKLKSVTRNKDDLIITKVSINQQQI